MSEATLRSQLNQMARLGIDMKTLRKELPYITWHTMNNYFHHNNKMNQTKRLALEGAISGVIRKYS